MARVSLHRGLTLGLTGLIAATSAMELGAQSWSRVGPLGGDVRALAADPARPGLVYLGTVSGSLYRSDDGGLHWRQLRPGFPRPGMSLDDIVVTRDRVYVGYWEVAGPGGGVARSDDGGQSFTILPGIAGRPVRGLAVAGSNPRILAVGTPTGVFRSEDGGDTWSPVSPEGHPGIKNVGSVAFDPRDPRVLYAGTWHLPWRTTDGGATWRKVATGMIEDSDVMTLTVDGRTGSEIYATACTGIYRSTDGGGHWSRLQGIPSSSRRTRAFARPPGHPDRLLAGTTRGLWVSGDAGRGWRLATRETLVVNALVALPGGVVLAGTEGRGVLRSPDGGHSWAPANEGFHEQPITLAVSDPSSDRFLASVGNRDHGGVFHAPRPEGPWRRWGPGLDGRVVLALRASAWGLWAGTDDGIYFSPRPGLPWLRAATVIGGLEVHPRVRALVVLDDGVILAATSGGLLRTRDTGQTWSRQRLGTATAVAALAVSPSDPDSIVAATALAVFASHDGGATWHAVGGVPGRHRIETLAFASATDDVLLAATSGGLLASSDMGQSWSVRDDGLPRRAITGLALHPDGRRVFATTAWDERVFLSDDAGSSWRGLRLEGLTSRRLQPLAVDTSQPQRLLVASPPAGLFAVELDVLNADAESTPSPTRAQTPAVAGQREP